MGHTGRVELIEEVWTRAWAAQEPLSVAISAVIGLVVLGLVVIAWPVARIVITLCHEAGHALVAVLSGRRLSGIRLHSDTSGLTVTRGRPRGPGMVATLAAGYPAASGFGLGAAALAASGYPAGLLWACVALLVMLLVTIRNAYGLLVVVSLGAAIAVASWYAGPAPVAWLGYGVAWLLLLGGPRPVVEALLHWRSPHYRGSDAAQLAQLTRLPRLLWIVLWLAATLGALLLGGRWLVTGLSA